MEVGEQQEDATTTTTTTTGTAGMEKHEEVTAMESGEEQAGGEEMVGVETGEPQEDIVEKEDAVMESLPAEVETDKLRGEREKAPDNAEERAVHEGGLGFQTVRVSDGEESRGIVVGLDDAGERNGTEQEVHVEGDVEVPVEGGDAQEDGEAEGEAVVAGDDAETEVEMADAAAAVDEGEPEPEERGPAEEKRAGVETNGTKIVPASMKRNASAALDNADGAVGEVVVKRPKKKANVWSKSTTRKASRKSKPVRIPSGEKKEECIEVNPAQRYSLEERNGIQLSKDQKAEKVELYLDKMQASSEKGYRMVRATRGVTEGAWYFEIIVKDLGATGHTRLGWSTWKGDLQAPVGFDANSYAFRDVDGSKVHQAIREPYSAPYIEGDVIGFYISLPNGAEYAPKYELYVTKAPGTRAVYPVPVEKEEGPPKRVPGSEVAFFKNGVCQGVAYTDIYAGEYFPAASMYTLPSPEKKCSVRFNFGPAFQFPVEDWGERPVPLPMSQAPPPEGLAAVDTEEPPPADGTNETKKSDTPNNAGGKQRMAAEQGNGAAEGRVAVGVGSTGSGVRTKRATDEKDRGKRPGLPPKKLALPKGSKKMSSMLPRPHTAAKSPMSDASLHIEVNLEGCSNDGSGDFEVGPSLHDQGNSSDTQTD